MVSSGWLILETVVGVAARVPWERFVRPDPKELIPTPPLQLKPEPSGSESVLSGSNSASTTEMPIPVHALAIERSRPANPPPAMDVVSRPGCTTADEALVVKGHLDGLAKGWGGFGVLRTSKERLDKAVLAAKVAGAPNVSQKLAIISEKLPDIKTPEDAERVAGELNDILPDAWNLGKRCKGLTPEMLSKARELAGRVSRGEITKEDAVKELSETT